MADATPPVAVIIPTYRAMPYAVKAVRSALETVPNPLVLVVDDASPDWDERTWTPFPREAVRTFRFAKNKGLTRSWNQGMRMALAAGAGAVVAANSDVVFPPGWWDPVAAALAATPLLLAGPVTNAPGHRPRQRVDRYLPGYRLADDPGYLADVQRRLAAAHPGRLVRDPVNGFCMAALAASWDRFRFSEADVFDPKFPMTRNEDELQGRWRRGGGQVAIVPAAFVWHYRGVSRPGGTAGREGVGWFRPGGQPARPAAARPAKTGGPVRAVKLIRPAKPAQPAKPAKPAKPAGKPAGKSPVVVFPARPVAPRTPPRVVRVVVPRPAGTRKGKP